MVPPQSRQSLGLPNLPLKPIDRLGQQNNLNRFSEVLPPYSINIIGLPNEGNPIVESPLHPVDRTGQERLGHKIHNTAM